MSSDGPPPFWGHRMTGEPMAWIAVDDFREGGLPRDGQAVLVRRGVDNWWSDHTVASGESRKIWRWAAAVFHRGLTHAEAERHGSFREQDQAFNNLKPYGWRTWGGQMLFGQDVTHWAPISDPCGEGDA
jgi:hypothetical protein